MSKNDAVSERGGSHTGDREHSERGVESVDLGIGIAVDLDVGAAGLETGSESRRNAESGSGSDDNSGVELVFDEAEAIDGSGTADASTDAVSTDGPSVVENEDGRADRDAQLTADERDALADAAVDPDEIREKRRSYRGLLDAGVDEATASALRRRFSLPWSFEGDDGDLERRSNEVRGLGAAEREWIAVSSDERWQAFEYDHSPIAAVGRERPTERPWPKPTPATSVTGVGPDDADRLAEAGIRSAERLATIDAFAVAKALDLDVLHVRSWRHNARELLEYGSSTQ
ncbi:hypothetical protein [Natronolimnohabitans innermongolicus]|uniref:Uncharacterized protein n=1 Tax=Natronolimnohabitans innermongolicus JCM 12255 TaxID=1227499 RepID=L9XG22_9EURY|nr:hypothetical protein [Natronolimnohabitans innermongolicus]ELY60665.1 hypothetical protein C493_04291 [Natronolimnohabitans innermongolicus JCM 12255]